MYAREHAKDRLVVDRALEPPTAVAVLEVRRDIGERDAAELDRLDYPLQALSDRLSSDAAPQAPWLDRPTPLLPARQVRLNALQRSIGMHIAADRSRELCNLDDQVHRSLELSIGIPELKQLAANGASRRKHCSLLTNQRVHCSLDGLRLNCVTCRKARDGIREVISPGRMTLDGIPVGLDTGVGIFQQAACIRMKTPQELILFVDLDQCLQRSVQRARCGRLGV